MRAASPRGLFRKYAAVFIGLVGVALLASGAINSYFSYKGTLTSVGELQMQKAAAGADRIEQFVRDIERQIGWTTHPHGGGSSAVEQRRIDAYRLQRQVPAITEIAFVDTGGLEELRTSRVAMEQVGSRRDLSSEPAVIEARKGRAWFGPVYFRRDSEPYMTVSLPARFGVVIAEVNLKFIWELISQVRTGKEGHAFVSDAEGRLIAHPDISRVLMKTDLTSLPQVAAALRSRASGMREDGVVVGRDLDGRHVISAAAVVPATGWILFAEQPTREAFARLYFEVARSVVLAVLGIALSIVASILLARRMVKPIQELATGAARIGAGELGHRLRVETGDELEALAGRFNTMADQLRESYAGLERKVEARTRELSEALEQQTATAEILRVISSSPTDTQPVFEAIAQSAVRLCDARFSSVLLLQDGQLREVASSVGKNGDSEQGAQGSPASADLGGAHAVRTLETRRVTHVADVEGEPPAEVTARTSETGVGYRALLQVPILRAGTAVGVIAVARTEPGSFSDKQVELVKTFADQAVIAIVNARLFSELQARTSELIRSVDRLTALGEVGRAVSSTLDLEKVLDTIVSRAVGLTGVDAGAIYEYDDHARVFRLRATEKMSQEFLDLARPLALEPNEGVTGRAAETRQPVYVPDIAAPGAYQSRLRDAILAQGHRALLAVPLLREDAVIGALVVNRREPGPFSAETTELLQTFAAQSAIAIENARLYRQLAERGQQLEVANRHKSEFLANMSHELRTPLNAVLGFSEVLLDRMFGDINEKQEEYLHDILDSGRHLLSLINDILDLSKVEAGHMELELSLFDLPEALGNTLTLVKERAARHGIRLTMDLSPDLGVFAGDARRIKQIVLNLLSNAVKFTPEGGRVTLSARRTPDDVVISVADTGIGIAPADQAAIFEEFRQVGTDYAHKREGTGLGLSLVRRFVALHGGCVAVDSELGRGSTFTFTLPVRPWPAR